MRDMKIKLWLCLSLFAVLATAAHSAPATMRLDYYHTGDAKHEIFSVDRVVIEPVPWPGNPAKPLDDTNLGKYFFEVADAASNQIQYSRGFASVFGEWEETDEAQKMYRTFSESVRFPAPSKPVKITIKKRDDNNQFQPIFTTTIDPSNMFVDSSSLPSPAPLIEFQKNGDPSQKVDFLILGDGYTQAETAKFDQDARKLIDILFTHSPFKEHRSDFNVWGLCPPANESGISRPSTGIHRRNPVGSAYDAFGSERYVLTFDNHAFREIAAHAPYEFVEILVNGKTYGGGGIFNLYSTVAADNLWAPYVFVHEFGHHFAGLADEYYTSSTAYVPSAKRTEPWEANATTLLDPGHLKWKDLVEADTPIPTPWNKEAFETYSLDVQKKRQQIRAEKRPESEMDALFTTEKEHEMQALGSEKYAGKVGAFEGANYASKGYYRPQADCIMFTRDDVPFCKVCQHTITRVIQLYTP
jgi:IgA Peptidase M64/Peptidase M64 N-terminus